MASVSPWSITPGADLCFTFAKVMMKISIRWGRLFNLGTNRQLMFIIKVYWWKKRPKWVRMGAQIGTWCNWSSFLSNADKTWLLFGNKQPINVHHQSVLVKKRDQNEETWVHRSARGVIDHRFHVFPMLTKCGFCLGTNSQLMFIIKVCWWKKRPKWVSMGAIPSPNRSQVLSAWVHISPSFVKHLLHFCCWKLGLERLGNDDQLHHVPICAPHWRTNRNHWT